MTADKILKNGYIWTAREDRDRHVETAEAIAISGDQILYVGGNDDEELKNLTGANTRIIDLQGRMVIPALIDSHIHIGSTAKSSWYCILTKEEHSTKENIRKAIAKYANEYSAKERPYIYVESCPTGIMDEPCMTKEFLDGIVSDRPLLLCDENFHRCLCNSRMLALMGIEDGTSYKANGSRNFRFDADGKPTGIVDERAFEDLLDSMYEKIGWYPPSEANGDLMLPLLQTLNSYGVGFVRDGFTDSEATLEGLSVLEKEGKLTLYYEGSRYIKEISELEDVVSDVRRWQETYGSRLIRVNTIKLFLDGTNEIGTSAVLEPFCNDPEGKDCGKLQFSEAELTMVLDRMNDERMDVQIHLVGDRAFRTALNAVEAARKLAAEKGHAWVSRVTLLHCELTDPSDWPRIRELGVYINWTPHWSGGCFGDASKFYLGEERFGRMYAVNSMIQAGAVVNYSSDVVDLEEEARINPWLGMQIGHTRYDASLGTGRIREPAGERLSRKDLLMGYTLYNAMCLGMEEHLGSLEVGKSSNLCVLNKNYFEAADDEIAAIRPVYALFAGKAIIDEL